MKCAYSKKLTLMTWNLFLPVNEISVPVIPSANQQVAPAATHCSLAAIRSPPLHSPPAARSASRSSPPSGPGRTRTVPDLRKCNWRTVTRPPWTSAWTWARSSAWSDGTAPPWLWPSSPWCPCWRGSSSTGTWRGSGGRPPTGTRHRGQRRNRTHESHAATSGQQVKSGRGFNSINTTKVKREVIYIYSEECRS